MPTTRVRLLSIDEADLSARVVSLEGGIMPGVPGDTGIFIDQATADRTLAFDAELVATDPTASTFTFKALGGRAGGRGVDFHPGDRLRLMVRHPSDRGPGVTAQIPGQPDLGCALADPPPVLGTAAEIVSSNVITPAGAPTGISARARTVDLVDETARAFLEGLAVDGAVPPNVSLAVHAFAYALTRQFRRHEG